MPIRTQAAVAIRLQLFGSPHVAHGASLTALPFERRTQVLVHLALRSGAVQRTELATLLWPETPIEHAHANLRKTLMRIRSLPWAPALAIHERTLALACSSDMADFQAAVAQARWTDALQMADAPLLAGFDDDANEPWSVWLNAERERLRSTWRSAARHALAAASDAADVLALASRLLQEDPLDEAALRAQMLAYVQLGQPGLARDAYGEHAALLAREMGAAPSAELQALHGSLGRVKTPGPSVRAPSGGNKPSRLVGRTAERHAIAEQLDEGCQLLSVIGPGGVGKSSLAQQVLSDLAPRYADGAVYVPLDDLESPDAVGARLARELTVLPGNGVDPLQAVVAFLRSRHMLLVLDNFEHLQAAATPLQALLDECPRVQMLVTSRLRLGIAAEHLLPLDGLPCPAAEDRDNFDSFDAVRLFVRAARAVEPALQPAREADAIARICRLVDGLPLALEIAAAWTRVLPCEAIAAELERGIELLLESDAARPARHASMVAVFEQSWQRLSPAERSTLARLTVFHGGFTPAAARAVLGATLPMLAALIDQSLLRKTGARADLHPLLRQLAAGRLTDEERAASSQAHAAHYLKWLASLHDAIYMGDRETLQHVDAELENVCAAWRWASVHGPAEALHPAVTPLVLFFDLRGRVLEGLALQRLAVAGVGATDARLRALLNAATAHFEHRRGRYTEARALAEAALLATRAMPDPVTRLLCFKVLGGCAWHQGSLPLARRRFRQGLAEASASGDPYNAVSMIQNLAIVEMMLGRYDAARPLFMRALAQTRQVGGPYLEAVCLNNIATLELEVGRFDAAAVNVDACLALCERHALTQVKTTALITSTELAVYRGDAPTAQRHGRIACELVLRTGSRDLHAWLQLRLTQAAVQQADLAAARIALRTAVEDAIDLQAPLQLDCVLCFTQLLYAQHEPAVAIRLLRYAIQHPATEIAACNRARDWLAEWLASQPDAAALSAPAVDLWTLLHRIAAETPSAHAALIDSLRST